MYKKQTNTVAIQSQEWIANSLIRLLETQSFHEITVTQICQEAQLVRKTFYRNFETKEDIFHYILDQLFATFQMKFDIKTTAPLEIFTHYYEFWGEKRVLLTYLHRDNLFYLLTKKYIEYIDSVHMYLFQSYREMKTKLEPYVIRFIAGGMVAILEHWLECNFDESIDRLTQLTESLLLSSKFYLSSSNSTT